MSDGAHAKGSMAALTLGALGVVYGDIGTSPLYCLKEVLLHHGDTPDHAALLGMLSLIFWSLMLVVSVKYLIFVMRADNHGEGGILALLALIPENLRSARPGRVALTAAAILFGAALLYGDGAITPAISVLSAMEGLTAASPSLAPAVLPVTIAILVALFSIQRFGTEGIGRAFGPVMLVWFSTIAVLGLVQIVKHPQVLAALSPHHAARFLADGGWHGFAILGAVVLAITGGEALFADMGHFGVRPIRLAWVGLVMPALVLCYFGQGALILSDPAAAANPFYSMVPSGPPKFALIALAAAATVIASQALISGAFSLTNQAVQLGFFPRVTIRHTSADAHGQIYLPVINWLLAVVCIGLVLTFQSSTNMAAAYGIAVCGAMVTTAVAYFLVTRHAWNWPLWKAGGLLFLFLLIDLPFLGANALKIPAGGYVPILLAAGMFLVMVVWNMGRGLLHAAQAANSPPWDTFLAQLETEYVTRNAGVGVFMASAADGVPPMLVHYAARIKVLPASAILLTVRFDRVPYVSDDQRIDEAKDLGQGFCRVAARYGYMQTADVPAVIAAAARRMSIDLAPKDVTYYLGRETFLATKAGRMGALTEGLFGFLSRNARNATSYFNLPPDQVVELGTQIDL